MTKKTPLIAAAILIGASAVGAGIVFWGGGSGDSGSAGSNATDSSVDQKPTAAHSAAITPAATTSLQPSVKASASQPVAGSDARTPEEAVAGLLAARAANLRDRALVYATDQGANQVFSYPPLDMSTGALACSSSGSTSTCTVSAADKSIAMIMRVAHTGAGWKVEQIEPVID